MILFIMVNLTLKIITERAMVFNIGQMVLNIKVNGRKIKLMDKEDLF